MDYEYGGREYCRRGDVPEFGSWNWNDIVPFTQCFETATTQQPAILHYPQDGDLYLERDLYDNHHHLVVPAVILLPRRRVKVGQEPKRVTASKEQQNVENEATSYPKAVDEDLYKLSPQLLSVKSTKKRGGGFGCIPKCFLPTSVRD